MHFEAKIASAANMKGVIALSFVQPPSEELTGWAGAERQIGTAKRHAHKSIGKTTEELGG